jgi:hypothetical protein
MWYYSCSNILFSFDLCHTLVTLSPSSLPLNPFSTPLKAIARSFLVLFHIDIWSPSTTHHRPNLLPSPFHLPLLPPLPLHRHCAYFIVLVFMINIWVVVQRGISMYVHCGCGLLWSVQSLRILSLTLYLPPPFFNIFQYTFLYPLPSHLVVCDITDALSLFSFPSFPEFHRVDPLLQTCSTTESIYNHTCFCVLFVFGSIFHVWEKTCIFCVSDPH